ncbi:MAG: hypothetical protein H9893_14065 [Candidatus Niameybacter stercoravium]|nr:hypothetical protein [Candidatus Niameybacter stercoravium]
MEVLYIAGWIGFIGAGLSVVVLGVEGIPIAIFIGMIAAICIGLSDIIMNQKRMMKKIDNLEHLLIQSDLEGKVKCNDCDSLIKKEVEECLIFGKKE